MSAAAAERPNVVVGVAGGIAAYKGLELVRLLTEAGCDVHVLPTLSALRFVGEASFAALSGNPVATDVWADVQNVPHVAIGRAADLVVVAPATADLIARAAGGRADDLLTAALLTATCPVVFAPAMHTEMWLHPATVANVATLRERGAIVLEPASGRLTGQDTGKGRLPDAVAIADVALHLLAAKDISPDMRGLNVVVSAGGTREPIDPVRFVGNRSSGKQGYALAATAAALGARVTLVSANVELPDPAGVDVVRVGTALEMQQAMQTASTPADVVVMAAAVADFRPVAVAGDKIKKSAADQLQLTANPDILQGLVADRRPGQVFVGFAAETGDAAGGELDHARVKLAAKGCDLLVLNSVRAGAVFGADTNQVWLLRPNQPEIAVPTASKREIAITVWHLVTQMIAEAGR